MPKAWGTVQFKVEDEHHNVQAVPPAGSDEIITIDIFNTSDKEGWYALGRISNDERIGSGEHRRHTQTHALDGLTIRGAWAGTLVFEIEQAPASHRRKG